MKCSRCNRRLIRASVMLDGKPVGPVCGRSLKVALGIYRAPAVTRERMPVSTRRRKLVPGDPQTRDWIEEMAAA
jgi:hypothetical protein